MSRIGEKIREARLAQNIPLKQIAKKCGVSESYLADVESGRKVLNDAMIKKVYSLLNISSSEPMFFEEADEDVEEAKAKQKPKSICEKENVSLEWQSAFSSIIKDVPVYTMDMGRVLGYKHFPIIDKKIEGYNPDKLIYIKACDNSLSGFRIKKEDLILVHLGSEMPNSGIVYAEYEDKRAVRQIKKLDAGKVLLIHNDGTMHTETVDASNIKILGRCIRAEIHLTDM